MLYSWLCRPHLAHWRNDDFSLAQVQAEYLPQTRGRGDADPFLVCIGEQPVGYIQSYDASAGDPDWWPDSPGTDVLGIDLFISDPDRIGQGLGTAIVKQFSAMLMRDPAIVQIRVDPHPDNKRAIGCFAKAGFEKVASITTPDGPAVMMVLDRVDR